MSDDSFIREVNDEMRRDQAQALWDRFGPALLGLAILVVLGTAAFVGYRYWDETRANRSGDAFSQALKLANDGKNDEALAALDQLEKDGYGAYPLLARMRAATVKADNLEAGVVGSGAIVMGGTARRARFLANGAGSIDAAAATIDALVADWQSVGAAKATVRYTAEIYARGQGPVEILGNAACKVAGAGPVSCGNITGRRD